MVCTSTADSSSSKLSDLLSAGDEMVIVSPLRSHTQHQESGVLVAWCGLMRAAGVTYDPVTTSFMPTADWVLRSSSLHAHHTHAGLSKPCRSGLQTLVCGGFGHCWVLLSSPSSPPSRARALVGRVVGHAADPFESTTVLRDAALVLHLLAHEPLDLWRQTWRCRQRRQSDIPFTQPKLAWFQHTTPTASSR